MLTTSGVFALAAFTGCFDYADLNNMLSPVVVGVLTALAQTGGFAVGTGVAGPLGAFAQPLLAKDIFLPKDPDSDRSRGVATHEYGHFIVLSNIDPAAGSGVLHAGPCP